MAKFRYQHITSSVKDKVPEANKIYTGEIAVNTYPGFEKLYFKNANDEVVSVMTSTQVINLIQSGITDNTYFDGAEYDSNEKKINFKHGDTVEAFIDATDFIKDGMVDNVVIKEIEVPGGDPQKVLAITFNTDAGKEEIDIRLDDIFNPDNYYTKIEINEITNNINSAITEIEGDVVNIYSAITNIEGDITEINSAITEINSALTENYYTKDEINEIEVVISAALNDLDKKKVDQETLNELEAIISAALNDLDKRKVDQETLDELEATISAALNDLDKRKVDQETLDELEATISAALNDLDNKKLSKEEFNEAEAIISASLNDLDNRKADKADINSTTLYSLSYDDADSNLYLYYSDKDGENSLSCDLSSLNNGIRTIDSMSYNEDEDYLYLYFTQGNGEETSISCSLTGITGNAITSLDELYLYYAGAAGAEDKYVLQLNYTKGNGNQDSVIADLTDWMGARYAGAHIMGGDTPYNEEYRLSFLVESDRYPYEYPNLISDNDVTEWFRYFRSTYVPSSAYTEDFGTYHRIYFYNDEFNTLYHVDVNDYNDDTNDYVTAVTYSNDEYKTLTVESTNGDVSTTLDNLALISQVPYSGFNSVYKQENRSYPTQYSAYTEFYNDQFEKLFYVDMSRMAVNENLITGITANLPGGVCDTKYITLSTSGGTQMSADCSSWFSGYASEIRKSTDEYGGKYLQLYNCNTMVGLSVDLKDWFMEKADSSAFTAHTADTNAHPTYEEKQYWNGKVDYSGLTGYVTNMYYTSNYVPYDGAAEIPAIVYQNYSYGEYHTLGYIDATDFIKDGMVENVEIRTGTTSGDVLTITFNTDAGKQAINIPLSSIFDPTNYYNKSTIDNMLMGYASSAGTITGITFNIGDGHIYLYNASGGSISTVDSLYSYLASYSDVTGLSSDVQSLQMNKADSTALTSVERDVDYLEQQASGFSSDISALNMNKADYSAFTAHTADTSIHFTPNDLITSGFVTTSYSAKTVTDSITDNDLSPVTSNAVYDWTDGVKLKKITQSDYDALVQAGTVDPNTLYIITD